MNYQWCQQHMCDMVLASAQESGIFWRIMYLKQITKERKEVYGILVDIILEITHYFYYVWIKTNIRMDLFSRGLVMI